MQQSNFFRINLPYGLRKNSKNQWVAFNREYMPLGYNAQGKNILDEKTFEHLPIFTTYIGLTEELLTEIADNMHCTETGEIKTVYLYSSLNTPTEKRENWDIYSSKIFSLASLKVQGSKAHYKTQSKINLAQSA